MDPRTEWVRMGTLESQDDFYQLPHPITPGITSGITQGVVGNMMREYSVLTINVASE